MLWMLGLLLHQIKWNNRKGLIKVLLYYLVAKLCYLHCSHCNDRLWCNRLLCICHTFWSIKFSYSCVFYPQQYSIPERFLRGCWCTVCSWEWLTYLMCCMKFYPSIGFHRVRKSYSKVISLMFKIFVRGCMVFVIHYPTHDLLTHYKVFLRKGKHWVCHQKAIDNLSIVLYPNNVTQRESRKD